METHHFITQRTARYYTLGTLSEEASEIWLLFHGYAHTAKEMMDAFEGQVSEGSFLIAPEGLNRFYAKGFTGRPVANWMTSDDRENEIKDYLFFIEELVKTLVPTTFKGVVKVLGFSQGVATATRWIHHTNRKVDALFLYAGEVAAELRSPISPKLLATSNTYITGNKDALLRPEHKEPIRLLMQEMGATWIEFEGGHEIKREVIAQITRQV